MLNTPAYAAMTAKAPLVPHSIERREPGPREVLIDILYCGICHSDIHQAATNGAARSSRWFPATRSSARW
jgi:D-arabinose 1-dehydrogenase-like Zn-dependent alcohol dehydrogenase